MILQAPHYAQQSMLDPAGAKAAAIDGFWHFLIVTSSVVTAIVFLALLISLVRRRRPAEPEIPAVQRTTTAWVTGAIAMTAVIIVVFLFLDFRLGRALAIPPQQTPLRVNVIGHQWWWEIQYPDSATPNNWISTANELHIPVGRPVILRMSAQDVIHSFWVPNLAGKKDLIPGHATETWIEADSAGIYRGQCAEFCGLQHAKMAMLVIAEPEREFNQWVLASRGSRLPPADSTARAGEQVFLTGGCAVCHTIGGTLAHATVGPDLTHFGSRLTIAAASLPNTKGNLGGWILDPQRIKPGSNMPPNALAPDQLNALLAYLEGLK
ncbi:MAG TPA: cytochrome c oxidase subunit II [Gemmatimonadaceae bacterium]|nr:cytochrome c oxidase subunit II [Gemmatimonadaceae bacterium]